MANPDGQIEARFLRITTVTRTVGTGTTDPAPSPGGGGSCTAARTLCTARAGTAGGTFMMNATSTLHSMASVHAGEYDATVEYLVS